MYGAANSTLMTRSVPLEDEIGYVLLTSTTENGRAKPVIVNHWSPLPRIGYHNKKQYGEEQVVGGGQEEPATTTL